MKKLIAISVMCALVLGAAFAETSVGGKIHLGGKVVSGDNVENSVLGTQAIDGDWYNVALAVNFGGGEAGGKLSLHDSDAHWYDYYGWWKPIPQLKIQMGVNADGDFGTASITGWGFTGEAKNRLGAFNEYGDSWDQGQAHSRNSGWYAGTGETPNLSFQLYPMEGLTITLWIPMKGENAAMTFTKMEAVVTYNIIDVGTFKLAYQSNTGFVKGKGDDNVWYGADGITDAAASPKVWFSFFLSAIEGMGAEIGIGYKFPFKDKTDPDAVVKTNHPIEIGLGFRYNITSEFQFKLRGAVTAAGSTTDGDEDPVKDPTKISFSINPNYKLGKATLYFYAGMGIQLSDYEDGDKSIWDVNQSGSVINWFVNPYIEIPAGDTLRFQVGLQVSSNGQKYKWDNPAKEDERDNAIITWAIPIGFRAYF